MIILYRVIKYIFELMKSDIMIGLSDRSEQ
jgi:hypothetical protein